MELKDWDNSRITTAEKAWNEAKTVRILLS